LISRFIFRARMRMRTRMRISLEDDSCVPGVFRVSMEFILLSVAMVQKGASGSAVA
jgi:hypothetical protein